MDLYVRNKNFEIIGVVDNAKSIIWNPKYYEDGEYEIYIGATKENIDLFKDGYFITRFDDEYIGLINREEVNESMEDGDYITVKGKFAESLIGYRIVRYLTYLQGTISSQMDILLNQNLVNPQYYADTRQMDFLEIGTHRLLSNPLIDVQVSWDNLLEYIRNVLLTIESSIKVNFNPSNNKLSIIMYTGLDRTKGQNENYRIVFSTEYDNLLNSTYIFDTTNEKNAIYVGGEGEGTNKIVDKYETPISPTEVVSGIDRKESYIDASSIKSVWEDENGTSHQLDITTEYRPLLQEKGKQSVIVPDESLEGKIDITMYKYREDYNLGDKVTIYNSLIGVEVDVRIVEIQEIDDEEGYRIVPIFK